MASELGRTIKERRQELKIGLRELAGRVDKSPSFLSTLENADQPPAVSEDTLRTLERELKFEPFTPITLAGKTPVEVKPDDPLEVEIYRQVKRRTQQEKQDLLRYLEGEDS